MYRCVMHEAYHPQVNDTVIDFKTAFGPLLDVPEGTPSADPIAELSPKEQAELRVRLQDVVRCEEDAELIISGLRRHE